MSEFEPHRLFTKRLEMVAAELQHITAELESPRLLAEILHVEIDPGWPPGEYDRGAQEFFLERLREDGKAVAGWYCWYAICRDDGGGRRLLVGAGGYFGPPREDGLVEIGFSVLPAQQGRGYATEMAQALVANASADPRVSKVIAHAAAENAASHRVLERCGFKQAELVDESGCFLFELPIAVN